MSVSGPTRPTQPSDIRFRVKVKVKVRYKARIRVRFAFCSFGFRLGLGLRNCFFFCQDGAAMSKGEGAEEKEREPEMRGLRGGRKAGPLRRGDSGRVRVKVRIRTIL